jgi:hypothetical protein
LTRLFAIACQIHIVLSAALKSLVHETLASNVGIVEDIQALGIVGAVYALDECTSFGEAAKAAPSD